MAGTKKVKEITKKIDEYIQENASGIPILKECCLLNGWVYEELIELADSNSEIKRAVDRLQSQKEVNLEKGGIDGKITKTMSAYLLERLEREKADKSRLNALEMLDELLRRDEDGAVLFTEEENFGNIAQDKLHNNYDE